MKRVHLTGAAGAAVVAIVILGGWSALPAASSAMRLEAGTAPGGQPSGWSLTGSPSASGVTQPAGAAASTPATGAPAVAAAPATLIKTVLPKSNCTVGSICPSEPSIQQDSRGTFFVSPTGTLVAPPGFPGAKPVSPLWISADSGATWNGPIRVPNLGPRDAGLGGGDTDLLIDRGDNIFLTSLWLGNTSTAVSRDGGQTWTAIPWGHTFPVDDRPWFAYDRTNDAMYMVYDGDGGLHVAKANLRPLVADLSLQPLASLLFLQDVIAVPRANLGSPGSITVDVAGGVHIAYDDLNGGLGVSSSFDGGLNWTATTVPGAHGPTGHDFEVMRGDSADNLYLAWVEPDPSAAGLATFYSFLPRGATAWHEPIRVSTQSAVVYPWLAVVSPGVVDVAYFATNDSSDPTNAPKSAVWDVVLMQTRDGLGGSHFATAGVSHDFHRGQICLNGLGCKTDRTLGDFFGMIVDARGRANLAIMQDGADPNTREVAFLRQP